MKGRKQKDLKETITLFHSGAYIEFQEAVEALYPGGDDNDRLLYESLIQIAAGIRLFEEFSLAEGAERMLRRAVLGLESLPGIHQKVKVTALIRDMQALLARMRDPSQKLSTNQGMPKIQLRFWS